MKRFSHLSRFLAVAILLLFFAGASGFPTDNGQRSKYDFSIDKGKVHLSGILVLLNDNGDIKGSLVNEFGISALDFICRRGEEKAELVSVMKKLDRWYIRKVLRKDLPKVLDAIGKGQSGYRNGRYGIDYLFEEIA